VLISAPGKGADLTVVLGVNEREYPAKVLACYSARADLVVIGRREEGSAGPAIGGTKHALLDHARGPVAVIPPGG
jgi:hypothetical protein